MFLLKVLLLSLRLYATEPEYEEALPVEPEVIHLEIHPICKYCDTEIIIDPYEDLHPTIEEEYVPLPIIKTELTDESAIW
jgi:hypothetical protein